MTDQQKEAVADIRRTLAAGNVRQALADAHVIDSPDNWLVIGDQRIETITSDSIQMTYQIKLALKKPSKE